MATMRFDPAIAGIQSDIFRHRFVRVEPQLTIALGQRFGIGQFQQRSANPTTLMIRMHGNVVQQQSVFFSNEDKPPNNLLLLFRHPHLMTDNFLCIVGKHGSRRLPYPWNIVAVGRIDATYQRTELRDEFCHVDCTFNGEVMPVQFDAFEFV